ncbi:hypothetical protein FXB39_09850 [Nocardioides sp. BGMRC 2183]|nr:hypothetical protein FXB39_09850 [Nocardioides sp. BGMRC 2183]
MTDLDTALREVFAEDATDAPLAAPVLARVQRARRDATRRTALVAASVVAVALAGGASATLLGSSDRASITEPGSAACPWDVAVWSDPGQIGVASAGDCELRWSGEGYWKPELAPDGSSIAYVEAVNRSATVTRLVIERLDDTERRVVVETDGAMGEVAWSPDGTRLAYWADSPSGPSPAAFVYDLRTEETQKVGELRAGVADPEWSPDGHALLLREGGEAGDLVSVDLEDGSRTPLPDLFNARWSPDGTQLVGTERRTRPREPGALVVVDARTGEVTARAEDLGSITDAYWGPDGIAVAEEDGLVLLSVDLRIEAYVDLPGTPSFGA